MYFCHTNIARDIARGGRPSSQARSKLNVGEIMAAAQPLSIWRNSQASKRDVRSSAELLPASY